VASGPGSNRTLAKGKPPPEDALRTGRRRWCRINVCGTEAKVRRFRERQRTKQ